MKTFLVFSLLVLFSLPSFAGKVHVSDNKFNSIKIYITHDKYQANLWVFYSNDQFETKDKDAWWYMSDDAFQSTNIYYTSNQFDADVIIYITQDKFEAKWNKPNEFVGSFLK